MPEHVVQELARAAIAMVFVVCAFMFGYGQGLRAGLRKTQERENG